MELGGLAVDGFRWFLAIVFALAAGEKATTLHAKTHSWHPVMIVAGWRRRNARILLTFSLVLDLVVIGLLFASATWGALLASVTVMGYTVAAWSVHVGSSDQGCQCFWRFLDVRSRGGLLSRNGIIVLSSLALAIASPRVSALGILVGGGFVTLLIALMRLLDGRRRLDLRTASSALSEVSG